ncbi:MAG TPA: hypothetical protein VHF58_07560 [Solirubrobacterales bacterium]|nr:hypothetical protein [Solirubrobacterales bacterium]
MGFLERFRLGNGAMKPRIRAELESEGLVLVEEGLQGSIRYDRFKAPGKRFYGKVAGERFAIGLSEERFVVYCRSGSVELMDSPYTSARLAALDVSVEDGDRLLLRVDYDRMGEPNVSGTITVRAHTPRAGEIAEELRSRIAAGAT